MNRGSIARLRRFTSSLTPLIFFVITAAVFGLIFLVITPPFQTEDEGVHFYRAYQISEFNFVVDPISSGSYGGNLPSSLGKTMELTTTKPAISFLANKKYNGNKTIQAMHIPLNPHQQSSYNFSATGGYSPIAYIPQSLGILAGRLLRLPPIFLMYLGRLGNLCAWIILIGLSIKLMPHKKWAVAFIGLIPMALFQAISESVDVMCVGLAAVFFAYIAYLLDKKKILTFKQLLITLVLAICLVLTKEVMFVFLALILLIPWRLLETKKRALLLKALLILIPLIIFAAWTHLTKHIVSISAIGSGVYPQEQIKFVMRSPYSFINVLWNTYFFTWGDSITRSFIGSFGWADAPLAEWIVAVGYIGLLFTFVVTTTNKLQSWFTKKQKIIVVGTLFIYWLAVNAALYVYYSPVGFKIIYGMQGRYFLPLLLPLVPLVYGNWLKTSRRIYQQVVIFTPLFLLVASVITIYVRYYINNV